MKRPLLAVCALLLAVASHADPFDDFNTRARANLVKPFALDLGGLIGGASSPAAKPHGFPGFSVGVNFAGQQRPDKDNLIMRDAGVKEFGLPFVEAGVGLPLGVAVLAHGTKVGDFQVLGGGLAATVWKSGTVTMAIPSVVVSGFYDMIDHDYFDGKHLAANAGAMWDKLPIVHPFVQVGFDYTELESSDMVAVASARNQKASARGMRTSVGVDLTPFPLVHLHAAYTARHGIHGGDIGLSIRF